MEACFIIIPFESFYEDLFEHSIKSPLKGVVNAFISKDVKGIKWPFQKINEAIETSRFCIADITTLNPNVMYEVGYAAALKKPIIILWDESKLAKKDMPFDVNYFHGEPYNTETDSHWSAKLSVRIKEHIEADLNSSQASVSKSPTRKGGMAEVDRDAAETDSLDELSVSVILAIALAESGNAKIGVLGMKQLLVDLKFDPLEATLVLKRLQANKFIDRTHFTTGDGAAHFYNTTKAHTYLDKHYKELTIFKKRMPESFGQYGPGNPATWGRR